MNKLYAISLLLFSASGSIFAAATGTRCLSFDASTVPLDPWVDEICAPEMARGEIPVRAHSIASLLAVLKAGLRISAVEVSFGTEDNLPVVLSRLSEQLSGCELKVLKVSTYRSLSMQRLRLPCEGRLFSGLVALRLSGLSIGHIVPGTFDNMSSLRRLDLSCNCLSFFPKEPGLKELEELDISDQICACSNCLQKDNPRSSLSFLDASGIWYLIEHGSLNRLLCTPHCDGALTTACIRPSERVCKPGAFPGTMCIAYTDAVCPLLCEGKDTRFGVVVKHPNELPKKPRIFTRLEPRASAAEESPTPKTQEAAHAAASSAE